MKMDQAQEFRVYSPDFQFDGAHLIEASAGTGKTYSIQDIYARLIMEKNLRVSQILVVTFTEAATQELRDRLFSILEDVQCRFRGEECNEKDAVKRANRNRHADNLIQCSGAGGQAEQNVNIALLEFDKSVISTIHGFCQRVLTRYPFETRINFLQEIDNTKKADLERRTEDWWRRHRREVSDEVKLSTLKTDYVGKISGKTGYRIETGDGAPADREKLSAADEIIQGYERERRTRKTLNFDDLLRALREALRDDNSGSAQLIRQLRHEFQAALIDEFQDTDPVQYEIFERIFLNGNPNPLFLVGDPKQAIYSFRGGDIFTYIKAKENPLLERATLQVNHRSTRKMVQLFNEMFRDAPEDRTFEHELIDYIDVRVDEEPEIKGAMPEYPLRIIHFRTGNSLTAAMPEIMELMVKTVSDFLAQTENAKPVFSPKDIIILTTSNERNLEIHQRLQKAGIPSAVQFSGNVFSSAAARELWLLLRAAADPVDKELVRCASTTVFCRDFAHWEEYVKWLRELNQKWKRNGFPAVVAELEMRRFREHLAAREDGEQQLANISQLWELCFAAAEQYGSSCEKMTAWLTERINRSGKKKGNSSADESDEANVEEYSQKLDKGTDAVQIMTIHKSKGLQAPVVILPDCWSLIPGSRKPFEYHQGAQVIFSVAENAKEKAKDEQRQEKMRLLYVAVTRARQQIILYTPPLESFLDQREEPLARVLTKLMKQPANASLFCTEYSSSFADVRKEFSAAEQLPWKEALIPPRFRTEPIKGSFSSLFYSGTEKKVDISDPDMDEFTGDDEPSDTGNADDIFQIPSGADVGNCWHSILEKIPFDADDDAICKITENLLQNSGFSRNGRLDEVTEKIMRSTLRSPVMLSPSGEHFALCGIPRHQRLSEQEFDFASGRSRISTGAVKRVLEKHWGGIPDKEEFLRAFPADERKIPKGFLIGFIDLIFRHGDFFYIADWKSNSLGNRIENFSPAGIRKEMAKHLYYLQYLLYAVVLHFYLKQRMGRVYSWEKNFGGIFYFFLRGIPEKQEGSVYADRPSEEMLDDLGEVLGLSEPRREEP